MKGHQRCFFDVEENVVTTPTVEQQHKNDRICEVVRTGNQAEDILNFQAAGVTIDDDNEPAEENILRTTNNANKEGIFAWLHDKREGNTAIDNTGLDNYYNYFNTLAL